MIKRYGLIRCSRLRGWKSIALLSTAAYFAPAHADTVDQIARMEAQMKAMQDQIRVLKNKQEIENRRVRAQLERQRILLEADPYAPRDRMVESDSLVDSVPTSHFGLPLKSHHSAFLESAQNDLLGVELAKLARARTAETPFAEMTATPPAHPDLYGPLRRGQIQIGGARITLGGFVEASSYWRSRDDGSDIFTAFGATPWKNSPYAHVNQFNETARGSRLAVLVEGMIAKKIEADAYVETDFGGAGSSSNSRQTNSYTMRMRVAYGELKDLKDGWYVLGGQSWSLLTTYQAGMWARNEQIPLTIDQDYLPGFVYARNAQLRVVKMFDHDKYGIGVSVENPSAVLPAACSAPSTGGVSACNNSAKIISSISGTGTNNPGTYYATDIAPDVVMKATTDHKWGHIEVNGVMRFFHDRSMTGSGTRNHTVIGGGVGGGLFFPIIAKKLYFRASGLVGQGIGRYGATGLPDVTYAANGRPDPLPEASWLVGAYGNPTERLRLYAYAGMDTVRHRKYFDADLGGRRYAFGYGNPAYNMSGCQTPGAAAATCAAGANINWSAEATGGFWYTALKGDYGSILTGAQYAYTRLKCYSGVGGHGSTDENMVFFSIRYLPFN